MSPLEWLQSPADIHPIVIILPIVLIGIVCCILGEPVYKKFLTICGILSLLIVFLLILVLLYTSITLLLEDGKKALLPSIAFWCGTGALVYLVIRSFIKK